ncbi:unnamed protein product [Notodromas monacha]|uniref:Sodium/hydrogen exchanger n=1 Tax=Notodromas monacha TaxID=399045 RepID=A0A7R9BFQ1_9CRUS|nr:unnamed protein product [Notodromas monacha]CAG0913934.1 unnamed protein product [Notodromas monacha]
MYHHYTLHEHTSAFRFPFSSAASASATFSTATSLPSALMIQNDVLTNRKKIQMFNRHRCLVQSCTIPPSSYECRFATLAEGSTHEYADLDVPICVRSCVMTLKSQPERHLFCSFLFLNGLVFATAPPADVTLDEKAKYDHKVDSLNILLYTALLSLTVVTVWMFKHRRVRYLHETGLAVAYGLIVGAIMKYSATGTRISHISFDTADTGWNETIPPDRVWLSMNISDKADSPAVRGVFAYGFEGRISGAENEFEVKATFDPEIFFNILLPPIIFNAGYSMKRRYFFRNLGAIMTLAFVGTVISAATVAGIIYGVVTVFDPGSGTISFADCLYFGSMISATDPVTVLAIFNDLHVDVTLYALVFGESILNDAVAIVLTESVRDYQSKIGQGNFEAIFSSLGSFASKFGFSFMLGSGMGCLTAILTKFTRLSDFPLLESSLFVLMSYSAFLMAEASDLTGIVAVLFCGICQAHYTYNNLSGSSKYRTKEFFELLNFLAENFIFCYIGVSLFTFPYHNFNVFFIVGAFVAIAVGRALNIYPLCFLLNLGRKHKITTNFQHMLFFSGLRGAIAFALSIRNTLSTARQLMLSATSVIVIASVFICGGSTSQMLVWLNIKCNQSDESERQEILNATRRERSAYESFGPHGLSTGPAPTAVGQKAWAARLWTNFDVNYMKPFLTHSRPTLLETMPVCCAPLARILTTTEQLTQAYEHGKVGENADTELCLDAELTGNPSGISSISRELSGFTRNGRSLPDEQHSKPKL